MTIQIHWFIPRFAILHIACNVKTQYDYRVCAAWIKNSFCKYRDEKVPYTQTYFGNICDKILTARILLQTKWVPDYYCSDWRGIYQSCSSSCCSEIIHVISMFMYSVLTSISTLSNTTLSLPWQKSWFRPVGHGRVHVSTCYIQIKLRTVRRYWTRTEVYI